jgi:hypothetical protein
MKVSIILLVLFILCGTMQIIGFVLMIKDPQFWTNGISLFNLWKQGQAQQSLHGMMLITAGIILTAIIDISRNRHAYLIERNNNRRTKQ